MAVYVNTHDWGLGVKGCSRQAALIVLCGTAVAW